MIMILRIPESFTQNFEIASTLSSPMTEQRGRRERKGYLDSGTLRKRREVRGKT